MNDIPVAIPAEPVKFIDRLRVFIRLKKREKHGNQYDEGFKKLFLTVHNNGPQNPYPFTDQMLNTEYGGNPANVPSADWNPRLDSLLDGYVRG